MIVQCNRECYDSKRARKYYIGDQDDVDPTEPLAMYFTFPPGTETYFKEIGKNGEFVTGVRSNTAKPIVVVEPVIEIPVEKPVVKKRAKKRPQRKPKPVETPEVQEQEWPTASSES